MFNTAESAKVQLQSREQSLGDIFLRTQKSDSDCLSKIISMFPDISTRLVVYLSQYRPHAKVITGVNLLHWFIWSFILIFLWTFTGDGNWNSCSYMYGSESLFKIQILVSEIKCSSCMFRAPLYSEGPGVDSRPKIWPGHPYTAGKWWDSTTKQATAISFRHPLSISSSRTCNPHRCESWLENIIKNRLGIINYLHRADSLRR
jgi:hypothetical protein